MQTENDAGALTEDQCRVLAAHAWDEQVGDGMGVWVSIHDQMLRLVEHGRIAWQTPCSTAAKGAGSERHSFKTPLGWHSVVEKVGEGAPWGQIFREKQATKKIWRRGDPTTEDLVLTRVLVLTGEEPGKNKGGKVDSYARGIYIHGTNGEDKIGMPASHGCVRLTNDDVMLAFEKIATGTHVLITE